MRTLYTLLIGCLLCGPVTAREIFVDNTAGDDLSTGQQSRNTSDQTGPVRTIAKALWLAGNGDQIVLAKTNTPYRESITLAGSRHSGMSGQPFAIKGNGAILDGSVPVPPDAWEHFRGAVFRFRPSQMGYQQLFLDDRPAVRVFAGRSAGGVPQLEPCQWCSADGMIYFCVEKTKLPADYKLSYACGQTGVTLYHVDYVVLSDLIVQGYQIDGIGAANSARHVSLVAMKCRGNGRSGVSVGGASLVDLDVCLLGNNGQAQLLTLPYSETHVRNSNLLPNTAPGWVDQGGRVYLGDKRVQGGLDEVHSVTGNEIKP